VLTLVLFLSRRIKGSIFSSYLLCLCGDFSVMHTSCLMKCMRGFKLLVDSILFAEISLVALLVLSVFLCCDSRFSNPVSRVNSLSISMWF
jgi:hypothetical protein